jgi:hypothetical protein
MQINWKGAVLKSLSFFFLDKKGTKNQGFRKKAKIFMVKLQRKSLRPSILNAIWRGLMKYI